MRLKSTLVFALSALGAGTAWRPAALAQDPPAQTVRAGASDFKIVVLQGEDGVNIIKKKTAVKPVVEVRDRNNAPVAGVSVAFLAPGEGASVTFAHGAHLMTVITDAAGKATIGAIHPVGTGAFKIAITASLHGQIATAAIAQTNYLTIAAATAAGAGTGAGAGAGVGAGAGAGAGAGTAAGVSTGVIAGVVAGAAAVAVVAAKVATGGKDNTTTNVPKGTIGSPQGPVFGPPH
jgi:hypothetical protein